jgi:hypothetical protein
MKTLSINQFDKKDEEIVYALISLGMSKPAARGSSDTSASWGHLVI